MPRGSRTSRITIRRRLSPYPSLARAIPARWQRRRIAVKRRRLCHLRHGFAAVAFDVDLDFAPLAFSVALRTEPQKSRLQVRELVAVASALVVALAQTVVSAQEMSAWVLML